MHIAVLYATKTGTARKAAQALQAALEARGATVTLCDLAKQTPDLSADAVALGGSIRIGMWHRKARNFAKRNEAALRAKPLALFAVRCGRDPLRPLLEKQIGQPLCMHAVFADSLGGELELCKQHGLDRFMVRMIQKSPASAEMDTPGILPERVDACADALLAALQG